MRISPASAPPMVSRSSPRRRHGRFGGDRTGTQGTEEGQSRRLRLNGTAARTVDELTDHLRVLWLTPAMDGLFTGPSADRRRFLDRLVLSLDPGTAGRASEFERAMRSRNRLLSEFRPDPAWLSAIEREMAGLGISMALARQEMLGLLSALVERSRIDGTFPSASLSLAGFLDDCAVFPPLNSKTLSGNARRRPCPRCGRRPHARRAAPHRSPDPPPGKGHEAERCSTGEQKALLVGLVLAHARLVGDMTGPRPGVAARRNRRPSRPGTPCRPLRSGRWVGRPGLHDGHRPAMFDALGERAQYRPFANGRRFRVT